MIDLDVRIDTVTWEAPLQRRHVGLHFQHHMRGINTKTGEITGTTEFLNGLDLPGGVRAQMKTQGSDRFLQFSGSLPRVLGGHNVFPATLDDCAEAMEMVEQSMPIEDLSPFSSHRRVRRVDLVRDFWPVPNGPGLINSIATDPTYRRTHSERYGTDRGDASGTIYRGPKQAQSVLYDKPSAVAHHYRHLGPDSRGEVVDLASQRVRYELRLTQQQLRHHVGNSLADIDHDHLLMELHRRFRQAQFHHAGLGVSEFVRRVANSDLTEARKASVAWTAVCEMNNVECDLSANTMARNRRDIRDLGLVIDQLEHLTEPAHLDFLAGEATTATG